MARRKSRSRSSSMTLTGLVIVVALLIVGGILYGWDVVLQTAGEALGLDTGALAPPTTTPSDTGGDVAPVGGEAVGSATGGTGQVVTVYFTDPANSVEGQTSGGIETHLIDLINAAGSSIDLAVFEFNLQNVADALIAAKQRGVVVRIAYDNEHTQDDPQMQQMIDAGIPAVPDERSDLMHNKFFIFDRSIVWTGSWNVTVNGSFRNNNNAVVIRSSKLAENYSIEFDEMFSGQFGPTSPANTPNPVFTLNGIQFETYFAPDDDVLTQLIRLTSGAQKSIHIMIFSFTQDPLAEAIVERAQAGVEVVGIFESRGANTTYSECPPLLRAGIDVRLDGNPGTFHHKVMIIDSAIVVTGSFNWSDNATTSNDENLLVIHDPALAGLFENEFNQRLAEARLPSGGECLAGD